jgi:hypothetical protein
MNNLSSQIIDIRRKITISYYWQYRNCSAISWLCFVDNGGIVDNYCLSFVLLILAAIVDTYCLSFIFIILIFLCKHSVPWGRRCRDRMVVRFTTSYATSAYHQKVHWCCEFESRSGRAVQHYVIKFVSDLRQVGDFLRFPPPLYICYTIFISTHERIGVLLFVCLMVYNATFNNISVISWRPVLLVEETGENHRPVASH